MADSNPEVNVLCDGDPLARSLAALRPAPAGLDPNRLVYLAGQAARDRTVAFWQRVVAAQAAVLAVVGCLTAYYFTKAADLQEYVDSQPRPQVPAPPVLPAGPESAPMPRESPDPSAVPYPPNTGFAKNRTDEPTPEERARWLQLRNDVLAGGIGMIPTPARPQVPGSLDGSLDLPRGVFAVPPAPAPKPKSDPPND